MIIAYILLFIVCLSTLVMVHEAGHLATAKMFNVYCFEYSIGFGPKIFKVKRKKGETYFSLRAIPFGGFVSMYGEKETIPEGLEVDPSRSLLNIKKWKRLIIMLAGVTMNIVLSIVIFFVYEIAFPKYIGYASVINVKEDSIAYNIGLRSDDQVFTYNAVYDGDYIFYDDNASISYDKPVDEKYSHLYFGYNFSSLSLKNTSLVDHAVAFTKKAVGEPDPNIITSDTRTIAQILNHEYDENTNYAVTGFVKGIGTVEVELNEQKTNVLGLQIVDKYADSTEQSILVAFDAYLDNKTDFNYIGAGNIVTIYGKISQYNEKYDVIRPQYRNYNFTVPDFDNCQNLFSKQVGDAVPKEISYSLYKTDATETGKGKKYTLNQQIIYQDSSFRISNDPGLSMKLSSFRSSYQDSVKNCFVDFADAATLIGRGLGALFTDVNSWKNVGGIIAVGVVTTQTLQENGFGAFLYMWSVISVNLAIINLLPFPGLDGWHCLVTIVEGVTRKELPTKFKTIMSAIGLVILFALMIIIVIKDIITFI